MEEMQQLEEQTPSSKYKKLDYTLKTPEERVKFVENLLAELSSPPSSRYLEVLGSYIINATPKNPNILTENRLVTIHKRETSYEGLVEKFENGEDGVHNLIINDKNVLLTHKKAITEKDIEEVPGLKELRGAIDYWETKYAAAKGKDKFTIKKNLIEMRKDQYVLKDTHYQPMPPSPTVQSIANIPLPEHITFNDKGEPESDGLISFFNPFHISALLCNYSALKMETETKFSSDFYYLMLDLDNLVGAALAEYPMYEAIVEWKIDGIQNLEIQERLLEKFGKTHSIEYISALWRKKIPKIIAEKAKDNYLEWYYTNVERGRWKKCSRCGQIKLAHNRFFSKNKTSKDGYYSICKECRNAKKED